jgi:hypothetical protein
MFYNVVKVVISATCEIIRRTVDNRVLTIGLRNLQRAQPLVSPGVARLRLLMMSCILSATLDIPPIRYAMLGSVPHQNMVMLWQKL